VCRVKLEKDVAERDSPIAELYEDRREESTGILLSSILEIKKEVGQVW